MSVHEYESLLCAANLAQNTSSGFAIKQTRWKIFLDSYHFHFPNTDGNNERKLFEIDTKRMDFEAHINGLKPSKQNRAMWYVLRIGVPSEDTPNKIEQQRDYLGRMITTPPVLDGFEEIQQIFREAIAKYMDPPVGECLVGPIVVSPTSTTQKDRHELPRECVVGPNVSPTATTGEDRHELPKYPHIRRALGIEDGAVFDPSQSSTNKSMQLLLSELVDIMCTGYELKVNCNNGKLLSFVKVPKTSTDRSFQNSKKWLDDAIHIAGSKHDGTFESAYRIANHLCRFYRPSVLKACETQQIPICKPMTATEFSAMMEAGRINGTGERELKKHLRAHLGPGFCPTQRSVDMLSDGHGTVHYGSDLFTYDKKEQPEFVEWTEKDIDKEVERYLQVHLQSIDKPVTPFDVDFVRVVAGGDHGDTAFQFGAKVIVGMKSDEPGCTNILEFEVLVCELICRTDSGALIEKTILNRLTKGLKILVQQELCIYEDDEGVLQCKFDPPADLRAVNRLIVDFRFTADLALQTMALGKESMSPHWCPLCKAHKSQFLANGIEMWTMNDLCQYAEKAMTSKRKKGEPTLGVKQRPWWDFIPVDHFIVPLLHMEIGIGNQLLDRLRYMINEHIEYMAAGEEEIRLEIPKLTKRIADTRKKRNAWDESNEGGKAIASLKRTINSNRNSAQIALDKQELQRLQQFRRTKFADVLTEDLAILRKNRKTLRDMRKEKVKRSDSIEAKMFRVLKDIGVELCAYHGGSLNGKDIIKVMNNAEHVFSELLLIFKEGKRPDCILSDEDIELLCNHFQDVFVLWDGAFSTARIVDPSDDDIERFCSFVDAALQGTLRLRCSVTPKMHMMVKHVAWQMKYVPGGIGDKVEDWVERWHQTGIRLRQRFRCVKNPLVRARARDKAVYRITHPDVIARLEAVNSGSKRKLVNKNIDYVELRRKRQRDEGRSEALLYFEENKDNILTWMTLLAVDDDDDNDEEEREAELGGGTAAKAAEIFHGIE